MAQTVLLVLPDLPDLLALLDLPVLTVLLALPDLLEQTVFRPL